MITSRLEPFSVCGRAGVMTQGRRGKRKSVWHGTAGVDSFLIVIGSFNGQPSGSATANDQAWGRTGDDTPVWWRAG